MSLCETRCNLWVRRSKSALPITAQQPPGGDGQLLMFRCRSHAGQPEWPAALLIVERLGNIFCHWLRERKERASTDTKDSASRLLVLECLGNVLSTMMELRRKHTEVRPTGALQTSQHPPHAVCAVHCEVQTCRSHGVQEPLTFPTAKEIVNEEAQPHDAGEDARCFCGRGYNTGEFMLDCDSCHRWFHGVCVGVDTSNDTSDDAMPQSWFCDNCRLSAALKEQRQRISRLLALPESGQSDEEEHEDTRLALLCSETEVVKQLIVNYLQARRPPPPLAPPNPSPRYFVDCSNPPLPNLCLESRSSLLCCRRLRRTTRPCSRRDSSCAIGTPLLMCAASRRRPTIHWPPSQNGIP